MAASCPHPRATNRLAQSNSPHRALNDLIGAEHASLLTALRQAAAARSPVRPPSPQSANGRCGARQARRPCSSARSGSASLQRRRKFQSCRSDNQGSAPQVGSSVGTFGLLALGTSCWKGRTLSGAKGPARNQDRHEKSWEIVSCGDVRRPQRSSHIGLPIVKGGLTRAGYFSLIIYHRPRA
jgi:hypothetical protein